MDTNEIDVNDISGLDLSKIYEQTVPKQFPGAFFNIANFQVKCNTFE